MRNLYSFGRYLALLLLLLTSTVGWSQSRTVTGKITDGGSPVPGVNILEKGTNNGTTTDVNGSYSISVGDNATLVVSFIGYKTQEIEVGNRTSVDIQLDGEVTALSEVVVIGYGQIEKKMPQAR